MKILLFRVPPAVVTSVALLLSCLFAAQTPPSAGLIRDVAGSQFVLVVKGDGSVIGWGHDPEGPGARTHRLLIRSLVTGRNLVGE